MTRYKQFFSTNFLLIFISSWAFQSSEHYALATNINHAHIRSNSIFSAKSQIASIKPTWITEIQRLINLYHHETSGDARAYLTGLKQQIDFDGRPNDTQAETVAQTLLQAQLSLAPEPKTQASLRLLSLQLIEQAISIYRMLGDEEGMASASILAGRAYAREHISAQSMRHFNRALEFYEDLRDITTITSIQTSIQTLVVDANPSLQFFKSKLQHYQTEKNLKEQGRILFKIANLHVNLQQFEASIRYFEDASQVYSDAGNPTRAGLALARTGYIYYTSLQEPEQALSQYEKALIFYKKSQFTTGIRDIKKHTQQILYSDSNHPELVKLNELLETARDKDDQAEEADILHDIGTFYQHTFEQDAIAIKYLAESQSIYQEINRIDKSAYLLERMRYTYERLGDLERALQSSQSALRLYQELGRVSKVKNALSNIQQIQNNLDGGINLTTIADEVVNQYINVDTDDVGHFAISDYKIQASLLTLILEMYKQVDDLNLFAHRSMRTAELYIRMKQYPRALEHFEDSFETYQTLQRHDKAANVLQRVGRMYLEELEAPTTAIDYLQKSLALLRIDCLCKRKAKPILTSLANAYLLRGRARGNSDVARGDRWMHDGFQKLANSNRENAVELFKIAQDSYSHQPGSTEYFYATRQLGWLHADLENFSASTSFLQQAIAFSQTSTVSMSRDVAEKANLLENIGWNHFHGRQYDQAIDAFIQALNLYQATGNSFKEAEALSSLAFLLEQDGQAELSILFYKLFINISEQLRQDSQALPTGKNDLRRTVLPSDIYRRLSELLLQQNRVLEAQQVLDLLKIHELDDYLNGIQRNSNNGTGIPLRPQEQDLLDRFNANQTQLIALGNELDSLETIATADRTQPQKDRILELRKLQAAALQSITSFFESNEIQAIIAQLRNTTGAANLEISELQDLRQNLANLNPNTVLLYPLILDDRLELILVTPNSPPIRRTVNLQRQDLNRAIANYRSALRSPSDLKGTKQLAQQLYSWLIEPIEADLAQAKAESQDQTLLYAPDGALRYIPLAALHDGKQWLAEQLQINNITAASIDDLDNAPASGDISILAAAFSEGQHQLDVGDRTLSFPGLPFAGREVENLAKLNPKTETRFNQDFNADLIYEMNDYSIVHLATHATFASGTPEDSFILFGDGSRANLNALKRWNIPKVDLVVLSACETAVGDELGNGEEILGFGYLMQQAGAEAAIASLWQVSDGGTQQLMDAFYAALRQGHTKAKALQLAQQALIHSDSNTVSLDRASLQLMGSGTRNEPKSSQLTHPYYWAPFILIGNGL